MVTIEHVHKWIKIPSFLTFNKGDGEKCYCGVTRIKEKPIDASDATQWIYFPPCINADATSG